MVGFCGEGGGSRRRWCGGGAEDSSSEAAAGEEEPPGTEVAELAVSRRYVLSKDRKMGIAYLVSNQ